MYTLELSEPQKPLQLVRHNLTTDAFPFWTIKELHQLDQQDFYQSNTYFSFVSHHDNANTCDHIPKFLDTFTFFCTDT